MMNIFRTRIPLYPENFYYEDYLDFELKNDNRFFIFYHHLWNNRVISYGLDSIFSRKDVDFFGKQLWAMKKTAKWKKPFVNSVLIDHVVYDESDKHILGRRKKYAIWGYSLPLFSFDRQYAIIIKSDDVEIAYYVYHLNQKSDWDLVKKFNSLAID